MSSSTPEMDGGWPYIALALGALVAGAGSVLFVIALYAERSMGRPGMIALGIGGTLLTAGWGGLVARQRGSVALTLTSALIAVAVVLGFVSPDGAVWSYVRGLAIFVSMFLCALTHQFTLGQLSTVGFKLTRLVAAVAAIGLGVVLFAETRRVDLPRDLVDIAVMVGFGGFGAFGLALALESGRLRHRR